MLEIFGSAILGVPWSTETDKIQMKFAVNMSPKVQKIRTGPPLYLDQAEEIRSLTLTRRLMLSQIYSIYDLLGLLSPIMIKYKLILQKMVADCLDWDEELSSDLLIAS